MHTRLLSLVTMTACVIVALIMPAGASASTARASVIGGSPVSQELFDNEFAYSVALLRKNDTDTFLCGGSLIAPQWVLTAAHCKESYLQLRPRYAVLGRARLSDRSRGEVIPVAAAYQHSDWRLSSESGKGDMMLVKLARPATNPRPIALAGRGLAPEPAPGDLVRIAGWGVTRDGNRMNSDVLRTVELPLRSQQECRSNWSSKLFKPTMICAGDRDDDDKSACSGDSGSPVTFGQIQVGIVSFGGRQCLIDHYNVFTSVASYEHFVDQIFNTGLLPDDWYSIFLDEGPRRTNVVRLTNEGNIPVKIKQVKLSRGPFELWPSRSAATNCIPVVQPGRSCWVRVRAKRLNGRRSIGIANLQIVPTYPSMPWLTIELYSFRR